MTSPTSSPGAKSGTVSSNLTLQYDKVVFLLEPNEIARELCRNHCGRLSRRSAGDPLSWARSAVHHLRQAAAGFAGKHCREQTPRRREAGDKDYVVLRNGAGILAVYRVRYIGDGDEMLKRLRRWPADLGTTHDGRCTDEWRYATAPAGRKINGQDYREGFPSGRPDLPGRAADVLGALASSPRRPGSRGDIRAVPPARDDRTTARAGPGVPGPSVFPIGSGKDLLGKIPPPAPGKVTRGGSENSPGAAEGLSALSHDGADGIDFLFWRQE